MKRSSLRVVDRPRNSGRRSMAQGSDMTKCRCAFPVTWHGLCRPSRGRLSARVGSQCGTHAGGRQHFAMASAASTAVHKPLCALTVRGRRLPACVSSALSRVKLVRQLCVSDQAVRPLGRSPTVASPALPPTLLQQSYQRDQRGDVDGAMSRASHIHTKRETKAGAGVLRGAAARLGAFDQQRGGEISLPCSPTLPTERRPPPPPTPPPHDQPALRPLPRDKARPDEDDKHHGGRGRSLLQLDLLLRSPRPARPHGPGRHCAPRGEPQALQRRHAHAHHAGMAAEATRRDGREGEGKTETKVIEKFIGRAVFEAHCRSAERSGGRGRGGEIE